ncbi:MAG: MBL fold metallo-hydrolase [Clostridium perfringens]|nr:MBL fold metallo-hydrolase [Clostridium perfringens]
MMIKTVIAGVYDENCYIAMDDTTKEAVVMDPGGNADLIIDAIEKMGAKPKFILLTHGHFDHVGAVDELKQKYNIEFFISEEDEKMIEKKESAFGPLDKADGYIEDGSIFKIGETEIKCIKTPGHTPGGTCFLIEDNLFSGDTLFRESIGRSDFPGGNFSQLIDGIKTKLMTLSDDITVYPGHNGSSSIGHERLNNPFLTGDMYAY